MNIVYDPTCLEHYGVGPADGGRTGTWTRKHKAKYVRKVQRILNRRPNFESDIESIRKLPGTDSLSNTPEIKSAYVKMRNACDEYSKFIEEVDNTMHDDTTWLKNKVDELRSRGVDDEMAEINIYFDSGYGSTVFDEYLKEHPSIFATENKKWEAQEAAEHDFTQEIVKQFEDIPMSKLTFSDGDVYFRGLINIQYALTRTLDQIYDKDKHGGKTY